MAYDVVVVGGGHNGLVAAGYLAKAGRRVLVCERREIVGGAAVSEHPFGPDYTVTSLSYVVSLLPPAMVRDLRLTKHGYHLYPQGPYFAPRRDGGYLALPDDPVELVHQARLAAKLRRVDVRAAFDLTRLFTASVADLVEVRFESDVMRGVLSVSGVIGMWAGPRSAGTAYVNLHHHIGGVDGRTGAWGFPRGGMGGVTTAMASAAKAFGAEIRTNAPVARIDVHNGRVRGVTLESGEEIAADTVIATAHPQISFLRLVDREQLPDDFVADIEAWRSRSGTVKVNLAVDRLPRFGSHPDVDPSIHGGTIVLSESLDDVENAFQEAVSGKAATLPFADVCIPSVFDD